MESSVEVILARVASRWRAVETELSRVASGLKDVVGAKAYRTLAPGLESSHNELRDAVGRFEAAAKEPEVVIATTGTTSSGKSTLANLLIGDELLPKAVQEMSAGVVTIHHDAAVRRLVVEETRGATWPIGSFEPISAEEVQVRLESAMQAYRDIIGDDADGIRSKVEPPRFRITWPTRMGRRPGDFGLPAGAKLTLVDLPGLKYVDDDLNGGIVREQARRALCIVAYNSLETDPVKQNQLLREVIDQVKALRGSPARMLFVLNRIDVFRNDRDPVASELAFSNRVTRQIRTGLQEALSEYAVEVGKIEPIPLSSGPALYAILADEADPASRHRLLRRIEEEYRNLFSGNEMDGLPRSHAEWSEAQQRRFVSETRHLSRLDNFEKRLGSHITSHLPEILLPDLVDAVFRPARKVLEGLDAMIGAYSHRERKQAQDAQTRLEDLHSRLRALQKEAQIPLNPLREVARGGGDLVENLLVAVPKVERALGLSGPGGGPGRLSALQSALPDAVQLPLQRLNDYVFRFMKGEQMEDAFIESAGSASSLRAAIAELRSSPYGQSWNHGGKFEAADAEQVNRALSSFAKEVSSMATSLVTRESGVQADRMKVALGACADAIVNRIERDAVIELEKMEFQGLRGVFRGTFDPQPPRLPRVKFAADVKHWSREEQRVVQEHYHVMERTIWWLWLRKTRVEKTRSVVRTTTHEGISVDKLGDLLEGFMSSGGVSELEEFFAAWLSDTITEFDKTLERRLKEGVTTYRLALEQRAEEIKSGAELRVESVEQHRHELGNLLQKVESNRQWRSLADG